MEIAGHRLPRTFTVRTPSGGLHLYFTAPDKSLGNTVGKLGRQIDTRGVGGYVVGPGSVCRTGYYTIVTRSPCCRACPIGLRMHSTPQSPTVSITAF